ncbi:hypothetical protein ACR77J_07670 [Tissierella praeacuta]|uniref:hypothetical protein n=1 Tax=Tissierella praeacuta TaxID=43131 RepID=UPI003DA5F219
MCKYCDNLEYKEVIVPNRTSLADDNICDFASPSLNGYSYDCESCYGCAEENNYFSITSFDDVVMLNYYHKIKNVVIAPTSARFCINYCPMCGRKITDNINSELTFW